MKISVNKKASADRKAHVVKEILLMAQDCAERGLTSFEYYFKWGERNSFPPPMINITVEKESEGTVKCAYRGDHGNYVKYIIGSQ